MPLKSDVPKPSSYGDRVKVYVDSYSLLIDVFLLLVNVPKDFKRTLAPNIEKDLLGIVRSVGFANKSHDIGNRIGYITDAMHYADDVKLLI